ncbi:hypothetical protein T11_16293 [Trichinella zimbabwensis]|uniref:Uncharacterized protein n=1 Tax=Trichinella zimbabwensis TaxID=268475 RepID=A0A0V1HLL2_9BILA|nr:hypothetical protein T11_16293 [Trichinella zimbabwensis]
MTDDFLPVWVNRGTVCMNTTMVGTQGQQTRHEVRCRQFGSPNVAVLLQVAEFLMAHGIILEYDGSCKSASECNMDSQTVGLSGLL